ncbi:MAG: UDP-N-acetylmuramate dehydrogenase [Oscillatoriales cyanobacterium SM2_2_1]|nr:UDP-N-acetylmuramate dehydrogenase [Oscillatoriales cyanobacterium SM2_2_1]
MNDLIRADVALAPLTSLRVGGTAQYYAAPRHDQELAEVLQWAGHQDYPITILGAGSNLLISDHGLEGLVICTRHLRGIHWDDDYGQVTAAAGEPVARLAMLAAERGWSGLEWAIGIPGTVGGMVVMNAGAQGGCAADCVVSVMGCDRLGTAKVLSVAELNFSYRTSSLQSCPQFLSTQATLRLTPGGDPAVITQDTQAKLKQRHTTQPYHQPSCGSVFRNPEGYAAGWLIQQCGLKGFQIGQAQVSPLHANFIVNLGGATAGDVWRVLCHVQCVVLDRWAIALHPEVKTLGQMPQSSFTQSVKDRSCLPLS